MQYLQPPPLSMHAIHTEHIYIYIYVVLPHLCVCLSLLSLSLSVSPSPSYPSQLALSLLWDSDALIEYVCRSKIACMYVYVILLQNMICSLSSYEANPLPTPSASPPTTRNCAQPFPALLFYTAGGNWEIDAELPVMACAETRPWPTLLELNMQGTMVTGGLGHLMLLDEIEVWVCLHDKGDCLGDISNIAKDPTHQDHGKLPEWAKQYKEVPAGDSMCYVYHEQLRRFIPWSPNSALKMYLP